MIMFVEVETGVDAVRSQMIEQILHDVHLVWRDVMKRNSTVRAARHALLGRVVDVLPIPEVLADESRDQVVLRDKRKESASAKGITGVASFDLNKEVHELDHEVLKAKIE